MGLLSKAFLGGMRFGKSPEKIFRQTMGEEMGNPFNKRNMLKVLQFGERYNNKTLTKTAQLWLSGDKRFEPLIVDELLKMQGRFRLGQATTVGGAGATSWATYENLKK